MRGTEKRVKAEEMFTLLEQNEEESETRQRTDFVIPVFYE